MIELVVEADIARKAATYIREHGLAKNDLVFPDGRACFNGAIMLAFAPEGYTLPENSIKLWELIGWPYDKTDYTNPRRRAFGRIGWKARELLLDRGMPRMCDVIQWNNEAARTAEEVAALLDEVAGELDRDR